MQVSKCSIRIVLTVEFMFHRFLLLFGHLNYQFQASLPRNLQNVSSCIEALISRSLHLAPSLFVLDCLENVLMCTLDHLENIYIYIILMCATLVSRQSFQPYEQIIQSEASRQSLLLNYIDYVKYSCFNGITEICILFDHHQF